MKKAIEELLDLVNLSKEYCPWYNSVDSDEILKEFESEVSEMKNFTDLDNLEEELGDVLWDILLYISKLSEEGKVDEVRVVKKVVDKIKRRKPYLITKQHVSLEEAHRIWFDEKKKEKESKQD